MNKPLVSILMSAYNSERFLREALDSALTQTYSDIEVVVINPASTDGTAAILDDYARKDSRVRVFTHPYETIPQTRNGLLKEARGEFMTFLDSDDIYLADKVKEEVEFLETYGQYAAVYCDLRYFFDGQPQQLYRHRYRFHSGDIFRDLLGKMFITNTTFMMRREVYDTLGGYDESLGLVEDWAFFLKMTYSGRKIGFLEKDLVRYRLRWDNHTKFGNQVKIQESAVNVFRDLASRMTPEERKRYDMKKHVARRERQYAIALLAGGQKKEAWKEFLGVYGKKRVWLAPLFLIPSFVLRLIVKQAWKVKKKKLFIPV